MIFIVLNFGLYIKIRRDFYHALFFRFSEIDLVNFVITIGEYLYNLKNF